MELNKNVLTVFDLFTRFSLLMSRNLFTVLSDLFGGGGASPQFGHQIRAYIYSLIKIHKLFSLGAIDPWTRHCHQLTYNTKIQKLKIKLKIRSATR